LISIEAAGLLEAEKRPLFSSLKRVLAEDIYAWDGLPPFDKSAKDSPANNRGRAGGLHENFCNCDQAWGDRKWKIHIQSKDSYKFTKAGADNVVIASLSKLAMIQNLEKKRALRNLYGSSGTRIKLSLKASRTTNIPR
jgi:hypothetical protein